MNFPRLIRTLRYLKAQQVFARLLSRVRPIRLRAKCSVSERVVSFPWTDPVEKQTSMTGPTQFMLVNQQVQTRTGSDWNDGCIDKLLLYNLHYFDDLNAETASERLGWHRELIERWIDDNPAPDGNGWEPYPLSLRIVNWIKWQLRESALSERALESLSIQATVLSQSIEYHLLANHILANGKALCFAGCFFDGKEASRWLRRGRKILDDQLNEQILNDGGHFELSPMYHAILLEDILDLINLFRSYDDDYWQTLSTLACRMLCWLQLMTHPDGGLSYFNDATAGVAPALSRLKDYASRLSVEIPAMPSGGVKLLADCGYARYDNAALAVIIDVGKIGPDYQPGHGHCDCLSFELSHCGRRVLVNTGVSTYNANSRRSVERATSSHNTVSIESSEQSEIWSAFRVGRRAFPLDVKLSENSVAAGHDGYARFGVIHHREFAFGEDKLEIIDELRHKDVDDFRGTAYFHFHPDVEVNMHDDRIGWDGMVINFSNHRKIVTSDYEYCQGFYKTATATVVSVEFSGRLVTEIAYANTLHR